MRHSALARGGVLILLALMVAGLSAPAQAAVSPAPAPGRTMARKATQTPELWITADHSKHEVLKQDFQKPEEVTAACLTCHTEAAVQFHKTIHWTWLDPLEDPALKVGKGGLVINNF
ncbi:hypothetical protein JCM16814_09120 [Desulfobaculum senezii]|jgi:uncharacterized paraquat-inducible protein A